MSSLEDYRSKAEIVAQPDDYLALSFSKLSQDVREQPSFKESSEAKPDGRSKHEDATPPIGTSNAERRELSGSRTDSYNGLNSGEGAAKDLSLLLRQMADRTPGIWLDRSCSYLGEKAALLGFAINSGAAVIGRPESMSKAGKLRQYSQSSGQTSDSAGRVYERINLGPINLYLDGNGALFMETESGNKKMLEELPGMQSVPINKVGLPLSENSANIANAYRGILDIAKDICASAPGEKLDSIACSPRISHAFLDRLTELLKTPDQKEPAPKAIVQSNDYARQDHISAKLEDGFRTAGQLREFAADGSFAAADRAATVVDRSRDEKLNQIIADAKKQFADLPDRERAKALAEYVNKIMGPQDGNERALDERYRKRMQENAGKGLLLSEFVGEGACTQRALLLKVLADEMGLECSLVRGNGGSHVWNTFKFKDGNGKAEIFDTRAGIYGVESSPMHQANLPGLKSINGRDFNAGQQVVVDGKEWLVAGFDPKDGKINLTRSQERSASLTEFRQLNPSRDLAVGDKYLLASANGKVEEWSLQGRSPDGSLQFSRSENKAMARKELVEAVLELAAPKSADLQYLQTNWKKLVEDNSKLTDKQKQDLQASLNLLEGNGNPKIAEFRKFVDALGKLSTSTAADAPARANALSTIANTVANYPEAVHLPAERLINAANIDALSQVAESLAQSAPHEVKAPLDVDGLPSKRGDGYEHAAGQALQLALQDKAAMDRLVREGKLQAGDWVFVSASKGSVADNLKIDGMLVDLKSGKTVFIDFAMHQTGANPYATLAKKLSAGNTYSDGTPKQPWALTLDNSAIGWDPNTGLSSSSPNSEKILERLGAYLKGKQVEELKLTGITQKAPTQYNLAKLRSELGGKLFNFGPVNGQLEAEILSQDSGQSVKTRQQELADIAKAARKGYPEVRIFGQAADAAANAASDIATGTDLFTGGLRAAVEAAKYGVQESVYKPGNKLPEVEFSAGQDSDPKLPEKYRGKKFIGFTADDNLTERGNKKDPSILRIYENGDVLVQCGKDEFRKIGNVKDLGTNIARDLQKNGIDPRAFSNQIKEMSRVGKNFSRISADMEAVKNGSMSAEQFWNKHKEMRLLADGIQHGQATQRAAQEARPLYTVRQHIEGNPVLANLSESEKNELAQRSVDLTKQTRTNLSLEEVRNLIALEKQGLKTADALEALKFGRELGKDSASWTAAELKGHFESAKSAQATDFSTIKDLPQVYRLQQLQKQLHVDARDARMIYTLKTLLPASSNSDLLAVKQMYEQIRTSGIKALSLEGVADIFSRHGILKQAEINELGRLANELKQLRPAELASVAMRNIQVESLYGVDKGKADAIRSKVSDLLKTGAAIEQAHDTAALMVIKNIPQADAFQLAKTLTEVRLRHPFNSFTELSDTASLLHSVRKLGAESIRSQLETLVLDGINKHGNNLNKLKDFLQEELFNRGAGDAAHNTDWAKAYDAIEQCKTAKDFVDLMGLPSEESAQKAALEGYQKLFKPAAADDTTLSGKPGETNIDELQGQLQGNKSFQRLTDEARMNEALKQLTDRTLQRMPAGNEERGVFLTQQLKAAMRKQLSVLTDAELPESLRNLEVRVVDSDASAPRVVQSDSSGASILEIPSKLLKENLKGALVDAYTHASGLSLLDLLHEKGNTAVTMRSLEPLLSKIAGQAEKMVGARSLVLASQKQAPITADAAASDRVIALDSKKPLVTTWDGNYLTVGSEKFHITTEIDKLEKERSAKVKDLEEQYRKAKELADSTKNGADIAKAKSLETQIANEKQNLMVVSELRLALNGQQGQAAQERARNLVKTAADRTIADRMKPKTGGSLSRGAAIAMVVTTLAFIFVSSEPAKPDTYSGSFKF